MHFSSNLSLLHLISEYKAEINIAHFKETTSEIKLNAIEASVEDISPVFEKDTATFSASIKGPSKPNSVVLVHQGGIFALFYLIPDASTIS